MPESFLTATDMLLPTIGRNLPSLSQNASTGGQMSYERLAAAVEASNAQMRDDNDRNYKLKKNEVEQQYKIAKLNAKTQRERNEIDRWYNQQQVQLAQERLAQDKYEFEQEHALNKGRLGYDVLNMAAQLRGPENYFQAANFARGVADDPNSAGFLNALKDNIGQRSYGAQYSVPDPVTLNSLASSLGTPFETGAVQPGALSPGNTAAADDTRLNQIRGLYAGGAHKLGAGALEGLTADEFKLLQSGIDAIGGSGATFLDQYRRSRVGNRSQMANVA